ncbi:MAG: helix-turn-helix transcriptional regulator [Lachnospiraceae bacterium]|nr:helix-turn-helix transcriptional regulator [Lachnospiraceae bacterium]
MNRTALGIRIRQERLNQNLTQEQLAEKLNVSTTYMGYIERGERTLTLSKLIDLANLLDVSIDYLLMDSISSSPSSREKLWLKLLSSASEAEQELILEMAKLILKHSAK